MIKLNITAIERMAWVRDSGRVWGWLVRFADGTFTLVHRSAFGSDRDFWV